MRSYIYNKNSVIGSQAEHCGMRTYYFSADTQEDMNGWIRAMNQAALMQQSHTLKRLVSLHGVDYSLSWMCTSNNIFHKTASASEMCLQISYRETQSYSFFYYFLSYTTEKISYSAEPRNNLILVVRTAQFFCLP